MQKTLICAKWTQSKPPPQREKTATAPSQRRCWGQIYTLHNLWKGRGAVLKNIFTNLPTKCNFCGSRGYFFLFFSKNRLFWFANNATWAALCTPSPIKDLHCRLSPQDKHKRRDNRPSLLFLQYFTLFARFLFQREWSAIALGCCLCPCNSAR